jgi:hypothetical protein
MLLALSKEIVPMNRTRAFVAVSVVLVGAVACGVSFAQSPMTSPAKTPAPAAAAPISSNPSVATQVETWTKKQWDAAKQEWAKEKIKWADCEKQSDKQKLEGRKSWSFLYKCMKT